MANSYFTQTLKILLKSEGIKSFSPMKLSTEDFLFSAPELRPIPFCHQQLLPFRSEDKQGALSQSLNYEELETVFPCVTAECPAPWAIVNAEQFLHLWLPESLPGT